ncbi:MAG: hypothetical protein DRQ61_04530 [Gammaproteobacteria bacterium]|nr:MAG: hypothetical protein DRQ61_04530 [Gammaproteobacteria bacterium]
MNWLTRIIAVFLVALLIPLTPTWAAVEDLSVSNYQFVSKTRVSRSNYDYTYRITLANAGGALENVVATVASSSSRTVITDGEVTAGNISSGDTPSSDTFTFRQNRRYRFNPGALSWSFTADEPEPQPSNPPTITSTPVTTGSINQPYSYGVTATDPDLGDMLTYSLMQAPSGMSIDSNSGVISWLPVTTGPADVDLIVTDSGGLTDRQIYLLRVNGGDNDQPPTLAPIADQNTVAGQGIMLFAVGSDPESEVLRYGLSNAPTGMGINTGSGELAWTPALDQSGSFSATVTVTDPGGLSDSTSFNINVLDETPNNPPQIDAVADIYVDPLSSVQLNLTAADADPSDILAFALSGAPQALQFDSRTGSINWIPSPEDAGTLSLTATVTDSFGDSDNTTFSIIVANSPAAPVAVDDAYAIDRNDVLDIPVDGVLENDSDANNDLLSTIKTADVTRGSLDSFPGDGSLIYTPPVQPPITVGFDRQCNAEPDVVSRSGSFAVGDVDGDGDTEIVGIRIIGGSKGSMWIIDGTTCATEFPPTSVRRFASESKPALLDIDGDGDLEIIAPADRALGSTVVSNLLMAVHHDNSLAWPGNNINGTSESLSHDVFSWRRAGVTLADLDGDGSVEILMAYVFQVQSVWRTGIAAYNSADGTLLWEYDGQPFRALQNSTRAPLLHVIDLDLDGTREIIIGQSVVDHNGQLEFLLPIVPRSGRIDLTALAFANFDTDPFPEILVRDKQHHYLFNHDGSLIWRTDVLTNTNSQITIADLDGDGAPEFAYFTRFGVSNGFGEGFLIAYDTDGTLMWSHENDPALHQNSSMLGASTAAVSAFDFDADGDDDLFYAGFPILGTGQGGPNNGIYIIDGFDGSVMAFDHIENGNHNVEADLRLTLADVDGDGAAEMIYGSQSLNNLPVRVLQGLPNNPWPPTRAVYNQHNYQPTQVNGDSSIPDQPRPHWLIPGLNSYRAHPVVPGEDPGATDQFKYVASDDTATSNEATVTIAITNVNSPTLVSQPLLGASPGFAYEYGLLATDADFGDEFTFTLVDAPAGMTVNSFGIIDWIPSNGTLGNQRVQVVVTDSDGNTDEQSFTINVMPPVTVPDIIGDDETGASNTLQGVGLAVGSITQSFSLTVPAGDVISQSVIGGDETAAGAFIDFVVSLGPQPIFVPTLTDLSLAAAQSQLDSIGLNLGAVSYSNSDTVPMGLVLTQSTQAGQQVDVGAAIVVVLSSGPAIQLALDQPMVSSGDTLPVSITVFDNNGVAMNPQPAVTLSLNFDPGAVSGTLPVAGATQISTAADTSGAYTLIVDAGAFGSTQANFIVRKGLAGDDYYGPIAELANTIDDAQSVYTELVTAVADNNLAQIQALGAQLVALRGSIDLEILAGRTPFAPETGFIPSAQQATDAGFPSSFTERDTLPAIFKTLELAINDNRVFLERLDPNRGRDDDVRARSLNDQLTAGVAALGFNRSVGAQVQFQAQYYVLLSRLIPELIVADLDRGIAILTDAGLLAANLRNEQLEHYASMTPQAFYADTRDVLFTLGGVMSASSIRMTIIKNLYVPIIKQVTSSVAVMKKANALIEQRGAESLEGIITAASLSFHFFNVENSVIEVVGLSDDARAFEIKVIGPDKYEAILDILTGGPKPSPKALKKLIDDTTKGVGEQVGIGTELMRGCILTLDPQCSQVIVGFGFPVVHTSGGFPGGVLVMLEDISYGRLFLGVYAFFPN